MDAAPMARQVLSLHMMFPGQIERAVRIITETIIRREEK
jgi:hypothetical protein